jgi:hypothetical protein
MALDFKQAWNRVKWELVNRSFTETAFDIAVWDYNREEWLIDLAERYEKGQIYPQSCEIIDVPKDGFHIRPGARITVEEHVVFTALIQEMFPSLKAYLSNPRSQRDFAYKVRTKTSVPWTEPRHFSGWNSFKDESIKKLEAGASHMLVSDLAGFYENINLERLRSRLLQLKLDVNLVDEVMSFLKVWAEPRGRGIPQGMTTSDLLAKVYLEPIDRQLIRLGFDHFRYVDDIRVFTKSELSAKLALMNLTTLLREAGLNLQTKKTDVLSATEAKASIEGKIPTIEALSKELTDAVKEHGFGNPYLTVEDFDSLEDQQSAVALKVLEGAFLTNFITHSPSYDTSLLHYLLTRMGKMGSRIAVEYSIGLLSNKPHETPYILTYLQNFKEDEDIILSIANYFSSNEAIYDYQKFLILRWLHSQRVSIEPVLSLCRTTIQDKTKPIWLKSFAYAILGSHGDDADHEMIQSRFWQVPTEDEKVLIICALATMNEEQRDEFYTKAGKGSLHRSFAMRWAQSVIPKALNFAT